MVKANWMRDSNSGSSSGMSKRCLPKVGRGSHHVGGGDESRSAAD
jgi:hypothetical protein